MKTARTVTAALAALLLAVPADAQQLEGYGVTAGLNRATLGGEFMDLLSDLGADINPRYGFAVGGFASYQVAASTTVRGELTLSQKGVRVPETDELNSREIDFMYLDLAATARRAFPVSTVEAWVGAGPVVSFNVSATGRIAGDEFDMDDEVESTDFGLALEAGANRGPLGVGLRYVLGLSNVSNSPDPDEGSKNRGLQILFSWDLRR